MTFVFFKKRPNLGLYFKAFVNYKPFIFTLGLVHVDFRLAGVLLNKLILLMSFLPQFKQTVPSIPHSLIFIHILLNVLSSLTKDHFICKWQYVSYDQV